MTASNFNTRNDNFSKLLGNGVTYRVPRFQRDYSWGDDEWEDLWADILETVKVNGEPAHYMGYLVLQTTNGKVYDVIDGQQRLTTMSIIVLAAMRNLEELAENPADNGKSSIRSNRLRETYIGYLDPVTLLSKSKLELNRNSDYYYKTYLASLKKNPPQRNINASENALRKSYEYFYQKINEYTKDELDKSAAIADLTEKMSHNLFFTVILVTDELNAYKVFETLNARGVRLSSTDLLKNYLFHVLYKGNIDQKDLDLLDERWQKMVHRLGEEDFPDFLRNHWNSRNKFVRQNELFKKISSAIKDRGEVFNLLRNVEDDIDIYLGLSSPEASHLSQNAKENASILKLFDVTQPYPLLMTAFRNFEINDFEKILRWITIISFRYNVICKLQTNEQASRYSSAAENITAKKVESVDDLIPYLRNIYPSDDNFRTAFAERLFNTKNPRNTRILKYLLGKIEYSKSQLTVPFQSDKVTIEHICPLNPETGWNSFTNEERESLCGRLGNLTLLPDNVNREIGNASYEEKRQKFQSSPYKLTQEIAENYSEWSPSTIESRQKEMAKIATSIWRIDQLS